jgi:hypothetical protein
MGYGLSIKNYGPLPAQKFRADIRYYLNTIQEHAEILPQQPYTLNPTEKNDMEGVVTEVNYRDVMNGVKVVTLHLTISYDGPEGHYEECEIHRYVAKINAFMTAGSCP